MSGTRRRAAPAPMGDAIVTITVKVKAEDTSAFLKEWDEIREKISETSYVESAYVEMPRTRIELEV